jgi:hypothetical protein
VRWVSRRVVVMLLVLAGTASVTHAQPQDSGYAGALLGVATLSADARSSASPPNAQVSLYKPENGLALNVFAGVDLTSVLTAQANYVWNANDVALFSSFLSPSSGGFYEQQRASQQQAVVADLLLYFRGRGSAVRPYLSTGVGVVRFTSGSPRSTIESGASAPHGRITRTLAALRVAVGIDLAFGRRYAFRYSFSETISSNPISARLTPPGERGLANFQNLFGLLWRL